MTENRRSFSLSDLQTLIAKMYSSKDEARGRGVPSPDRADSLILAFAQVGRPGFTPVAVTRRR